MKEKKRRHRKLPVRGSQLRGRHPRASQPITYAYILHSIACAFRGGSKQAGGRAGVSVGDTKRAAAVLASSCFIVSVDFAVCVDSNLAVLVVLDDVLSDCLVWLRVFENGV